MTNGIKIGFIGVGNMSGAVIDAILHAQIVTSEQIYLYNPTVSKLARFNGANICSSNSEVADSCELIFLGIKPQMLSSVAPEVNGNLSKKCVVSMLAGVSTSSLHTALGSDVFVIRTLPNTPLLVGKGTTVIAKPCGVPEHFESAVNEIFSAAGVVKMLDESLINEAIPLSSSSPAFFFRMISAMTASGVRRGISESTAMELALSTMHGACHMMEQSNETTAELIAKVTSKGGTTLAALSAFDDCKFEELIDDAFDRCIARAEELGKAK
ncbi:MAG: pyrroline-5-carboxylate reductase [Clostridia bacterium]